MKEMYFITYLLTNLLTYTHTQSQCCLCCDLSQILHVDARIEKRMTSRPSHETMRWNNHQLYVERAPPTDTYETYSCIQLTVYCTTIVRVPTDNSAAHDPCT